MTIVTTEDRGTVRYITLRRPEKRNALDEALIAAFVAEVEVAADAPDIHIVVIRGEGPAFCAGIDRGWLARQVEHGGGLTHQALFETFRPVHRGWTLLEEMPKVTICQVQGMALGAGMEISLACDLRVIAEDAVLALTESKLGAVPDCGGCARLPAIVGVGRAKEIVLTGRPVDGAEAYRIGLATRVAPAAELDACTEALIAELRMCAPLANAHAKRILDTAAKPLLKTTLEQEMSAQVLLLNSADAVEAAVAYGARRAPDFVGR